MGKEDVSTSSAGPCQVSGARKSYWRSASWSSSRPASDNPSDKLRECVDLNGNISNNNGPSRQTRKFLIPLTPRPQNNSKARTCLPPLQPLSIARRSLDEWPKAGSDDIGEWPEPPMTPGGRLESGKTAERLKLDMSVINLDKNGGLVKRDKIACFDKECSKVAEHIYLGGDIVARSRDILKKNGITHVLNCVGFVCPEYFKAEFVYKTLWLQDNPSEDITSILYDVFDYFEDVREQGGRVFVHCCQGVSRSTSLVIAYLMWREGQSFDDAFQYVKAARGIADPNMGFACQLLQCQKRVHAVPLSPNSLLRMYRIAPHSPYDPLHLVPKMLNDPSPSSLDSRGVFIIQVPSAICVWVGKNCEAIMERDARGAVGQIVRYERVQAPIIMMKEGEEPTFFWDVFSTLLPLMDKPCNGLDIRDSCYKNSPGERKVDMYNVDFEIFQKAIIGGFAPPSASSVTALETCLPVRESSWSVLRRKFALGSMKEFISAQKVPFFRAYSDSMSTEGADSKLIAKLSQQSPNLPKTSLPSSLSSSLSFSPPSPLYLSPESMTSNSRNNSKDRLESLVSSSQNELSHLSSLALSSFSNLSLLPPKSPRALSNKAAHVDIDFSNSANNHSVSSPAKKLSLSLAERRGNLSKTLKLPVPTHSRKLDSVSIVSQSKDGLRHGETDIIKNALQVCSGGVGNQELDFLNASDEPLRAYRSGEESITKTGMVEKTAVYSKSIWPLVCQWPSLKKISSSGPGFLNSEGAYVIISPSTGQREDATVYFWIGKSFSFKGVPNGLDCSRQLGDLDAIDWKQVRSNIFTQLSLPEGSIMKIIKEAEEPDEFLSFSDFLWHQEH